MLTLTPGKTLFTLFCSKSFAHPFWKCRQITLIIDSLVMTVNSVQENYDFDFENCLIEKSCILIPLYLRKALISETRISLTSLSPTTNWVWVDSYWILNMQRAQEMSTIFVQVIFILYCNELLTLESIAGWSIPIEYHVMSYLIYHPDKGWIAGNLDFVIWIWFWNWKEELRLFCLKRDFESKTSNRYKCQA